MVVPGLWFIIQEIMYLRRFSFSVTQQPLTVQDLLNIQVSRSYSETPVLIGVLWTRDQPDVETSTSQHTTLKQTEVNAPHPRWDSNPQWAPAGPCLRPRGQWGRAYHPWPCVTLHLSHSRSDWTIPSFSSSTSEYQVPSPYKAMPQI